MAFRFDPKNTKPHLGRDDGAWAEIFATQTDLTALQVAERILGDLWGYNHGDRNQNRDTDIASLAAALNVYASKVGAD